MASPGYNFGTPPGYNENQYGSSYGPPPTPMPGTNSPSFGGFSKAPPIYSGNPLTSGFFTGDAPTSGAWGTYNPGGASGGYSTMPATASAGPTPGTVPVPGAPNPTTNAPGVNQIYPPSHAGNPVENAHGLGHGQYAVPPQDQGLQNTLFNWLQSQIGQGITPFDLSALLPTGGTTGPGQVASPLDPVTQQLMDFFTSGKSSNPALSGLMGMAQTGDPISAQPEWQAMLKAMNQQQQIGGANEREQLSFTGNLPGSAGALGISNYNTQTTLGNEALIAQLAQQSMESAAQREQGAQNTLFGGEQGLGTSLYGYDTNAVNKLMEEYFGTTPQANPLNQEMFGAATTYPPTFGGKSSTGGIGGLLSGLGSLFGGAASGGGAGLIGTLLAPFGI